jgi:MoxR-like ATPase
MGLMATFADLKPDAAELQQRIERFHVVREDIVKQVREVIVGQDEVLEQVLIALFVGGHCLITGLPGTAKTLHAGPDAFRYHRHRHHRRRHDDWPSQMDIC